MSRACQVSWPRRRINRHFDGVRAIISRNPGCDALPRVNRLAERSPILRSIFRRHRTNPQMIQPLFRHCKADQSSPILRHKVDGFRRNLLSRQGKIAFVFAIFVVDDHNHPPSADLFDRRGNVSKWGGMRHTARILAPETGQSRCLHSSILAQSKRVARGDPMKNHLPAYRVDSISKPQASSNGSGMYLEFLFRRAHSRSRVDRRYWSGESLYSRTTCSNSVMVGVTGPIGSGLPQLGFPRRFAMGKKTFPTKITATTLFPRSLIPKNVRGIHPRYKKPATALRSAARQTHHGNH